MTKYQVYDIWRAAESPWSGWVKPVLFSFLGEENRAPAGPMRTWHVPFASDSALIADLPGAGGVFLGVALSGNGYRPIPVYNACPFGFCDADPILLFTSPQRADAPPVVDALQVLNALGSTAGALAAAKLTSAAPPAFLLDQNRRGQVSVLDPGGLRFDNRSFITTADFPSAAFFKQNGVSKIVLIQPQPAIQADLREVLLAWQRDGMTIAQQTPWESWNPRPIAVKPPLLPVRLWERLHRAVGYSKGAAGAFGAVRSSSS